MKSIFTRLCTLLLCGVVAMIGCTDFSADLQYIDKKVDDLSAKTEKSVNDLWAEINALKASLENTYAQKTQLTILSDAITSIQGSLQNLTDGKVSQEALNQAIQDLEGKITAVKCICEPGKDGVTPQLKIETDGCWYVSYDNGGTWAQLGKATGDKGQDGQPGAPGQNGVTPQFMIDNNGCLCVSYDNGNEWISLGKVTGDKGEDGQPGTPGQDGSDATVDLQPLYDLIEGLQEQIDEIAECECDPEAISKAVAPLIEQLGKLQTSFDDYKKTTDATLSDIANQLLSVNEKIQKIDGIEADIQTIKTDLIDLNSTLSELSSSIVKGDFAVTTAFEAADKVINANIDAINEAIKNLSTKAELEDAKKQLQENIAAVADQYTAINQRVSALENAVTALNNAIADLSGRVENLEVNSLRSIVLVPETMYNGTKAVKFHRMDGENALKTYAEVSFHFNPSNFDLTTAEYEIVAENVEFMTKAASDEPAIEIVGDPEKKDGKVVFLLERAEGAGNMFALKVTLQDGTEIYSEYAAILDEITYCEAEATITVDVQRLTFELPTISSLSEFIALIQNAETNFEELQGSIDSIQSACEAIQSGNLLNAMDILKSLPGFTTKTATVTGYGYTKEKVEPITAERLIEVLTSSLDLGFSEFMNKWNEILGTAGSLGEGNEILEGLEGAFGNSGITDTMEKLEEAIEDFDLAESAKKVADNALAEAKATVEDLKVELEDLKNNGGSSIKIGIIEASIKVAEAAIPAAEEALAKAGEAVDAAKAKVDELTQALKDKTMDYIENSVLGEKLEELEKALAEQNWEMQKNTTKLVAQLTAVKLAGEDAIANYKAMNQQVVDDFNCSVLGRILSLLDTQEAAAMFEELGLTELYTALKKLPDIITTVIKWYPAIDLESLKDFSTVVGEITGGTESLISNAIESIKNGEMPELNLDSEYLDVNAEFSVEYELAQ